MAIPSPRASIVPGRTPVPLTWSEQEAEEWVRKCATFIRELDGRVGSIAGDTGQNLNVRSGESTVGNIVGTLNFWGKDANGTDVIYGGIDVRVRANTAGAHSGFLDIWVFNGGAKQIVQTFQGTP